MDYMLGEHTSPRCTIQIEFFSNRHDYLGRLLHSRLFATKHSDRSVTPNPQRVHSCPIVSNRVQPCPNMSTSAPTAPNDPDDTDAYELGRAPIKTAEERRVQDEIDRRKDGQDAQRKADEMRAARAAKEKANEKVGCCDECAVCAMCDVCRLVCVGCCWLYNVYLLTCLPAYLLTYFCPQAMEDDRRNGRHPLVKAGATLLVGIPGCHGRVFVVKVCKIDGKEFVYVVPCDKWARQCLNNMISHSTIKAKSAEDPQRQHLPTCRRAEVVVKLRNADILCVYVTTWWTCTTMCMRMMRMSIQSFNRLFAH